LPEKHRLNANKLANKPEIYMKVRVVQASEPVWHLDFEQASG